MKHRHLTHEGYTLAAIDDILDRGRLRDWAPLLREVHGDPDGPVARRVQQVIEHHRMQGTGNAWSRLLHRRHGERSRS